jgi:hypothetical protein
LVAAILTNKSRVSLSLAFALYREKLNVDPPLRIALDEVVTQALFSKEDATFEPAAEAWVGHQEATNYVRLDATRELSGPITQAEFQLFLLDHDVSDFDYAPLHWTASWFHDDPKGPILGVSPEAALAYCGWLNTTFPSARHRLPEESEILAKDGDESEWACWCQDNGGLFLRGTSPLLEHDNPTLVVTADTPQRRTPHEYSVGKLIIVVTVGLWLYLLIAAGRAVLEERLVLTATLLLANVVTTSIGFFLGIALKAFTLRTRSRQHDGLGVRSLHAALTAVDVNRARQEATTFGHVVAMKEALARKSWGQKLLNLFWTAISVIRRRPSAGGSSLDSKLQVALTGFTAAKSAQTLREARVRMRRGIDSMMQTPLFPKIFDKTEVDQIQKIIKILNDRERGSRKAFEGIRVVREVP